MPQKTVAQLQSLLEEQIEWLKDSAQRYDSGRLHEAKRLAVSIRVLLHDTTMSRSLLSQLDLKDRVLFLDTAGPVNERNLMPLTPLVSYRLMTLKSGAAEFTYQPVFYDGPRPKSGLRALKFEAWWKMMVLRDSTHTKYSRKDLVLFLANSVGGAHVDPQTKPKLEALSRSKSIGFSVGDQFGERPVEQDPILPYVRQIAFELLETLWHRQLIPT
ncbi:hypothetical protein GCM10009689_16990 [Brevibacterium antiquum]|uniref:hypothetical protein n=1 Tax=Brevibacterium antiquum TaxID=234835 RepID=UPI0018DFAFE9|nr:hypothetical protein [Brevibacterium antiquum]